MEPKIIDYYNVFPDIIKMIDKLNSEYEEVQEKNRILQEEIDEYKKIFQYPYNNSMVFNLKQVTKGGKKVWIDKVRILEDELKTLDQCDYVKYLLDNCNPRCER